MRNKKVLVRTYYRGAKTRRISLNLTWYEVVYLWIWLQVKRALTITTIAILVAFFAEGYHRSQLPDPTPSARAEEIQKAYDKFPPILKNIAQAESHRNQFCTADLVALSMCRKSEIGQVLVRANHDKVNSVDVGFCQINLYYHGASAKKLGYDIFEEEGNKAFCLYLYKTQGTTPWNASSKIWKK